MSERDSDIEFDFFDDPETREATEAERPKRRGSRRPPVRPPSGLTPLLRLIGLISFAILIVVLLVFWVNSCREDRRKDSYRNYVEDIAGLAGRSQGLGDDLTTLLTSRKKQDELEQELQGLAQQQEQQVDQAREIDSPGPLRPQHRHVIEAFELRLSGLRGLAQAFNQTATIRDDQAARAGSLLAAQAKRLVASDVIWDDLFKDPARAELDRQGISGVNVPDSNFVENADLVTTRSMAGIWQRIRGAATGGDDSCSPRGTGIVSVTALPARQELSRDEPTTVEAVRDLAFAVVIEDSGCSQEARIPVKLTIQKSPAPIVKRQVLALINPGETKTVVFRNLGTPPFGERSSVAIEVEPVPTESTTANNSQEYPVFFSFD